MRHNPDVTGRTPPKGLRIEFYDEDGDNDPSVERFAEAAWEISFASPINILSDKRLSAIAVLGRKCVGGGWTSVSQASDDDGPSQFSFDVVVAPEAQGKGVGDALVSAMLDEFRHIRFAYNELVLNVEVVNPAMERILARRGFRLRDEEDPLAVRGKTMMTRNPRKKAAAPVPLYDEKAYNLARYGQGINRDLSKANLRNADLRNAVLIGVNLEGADLTYADLSGAEMGGANLLYAHLGGTKLVGALLDGASLSRTSLVGANLSGANLSGANLTYASITKANFQGAVLAKANLAEAYISDADFSNADMREVGLKRASLSDTSFYGADLTDASLWLHKAQGCSFAGANMPRASLQGTFDECSFAGVDFERADLTEVEFQTCNFRDADFTKANLYGTKFYEADLTNAVDTPNVRMREHQRYNGLNELKGLWVTDADLSGIDLSGRNLANCVFRGTGLAGTIFHDANLTGALFSDVDADRADFSSAKLADALFETGCSLKNASFEDAFAPEMRLENSDATGASFKEADLTMLRVDSSNLHGARFAGAMLQRATIAYSDVTGADFTHADLEDANFWQSDLRGARLEGANTLGAILEAAMLSPEVKEMLFPRQYGYGKLAGPILKMERAGAPSRAAEFKKAYPREFERLKADTQGRDFTPQVREGILAKYRSARPWVLTMGAYRSGAQRYCDKDNAVLKFNIRITDEGFTPRQQQLLQKLAETSRTLGHPHEKGELFTIGWVRYCSDDKNKVWLVEEVQSDVSIVREKPKENDFPEDFREVVDVLAPVADRFYYDALGIVFERAAKKGYTVEMLDYHAKEEMGSPRSVYTDLPRAMGMQKRPASNLQGGAIAEGIGGVWYYKPNPRKRRS